MNTWMIMALILIAINLGSHSVSGPSLFFPQSTLQHAKMCHFEEGELCERKPCKSDTTALFICKYECTETAILYISA